MLPMRDGVRLATDVYLPVQAGVGPWPAALARSIYGKADQPDDRLAHNGIVQVEQDGRGVGASEGRFRLWADDGWGEHQDGADTVAWIRQQPWCNGKVATFGLPVTQLLLAGAGPEGVTGQCAGIAPISLYHFVFYQNGVFRQSTEKALKGWPGVLEETRRHPDYDDFWRTMDLRTRLNRVRWPVVHRVGWFESFLQGALDAFTELQEHGGPGARQHQHLTIGPWAHGNDTSEVGELRFPRNASEPPGIQADLPWLLHWLKGEALPTLREPHDEPAVRYYVMGDVTDPKAPGNTWRAADRWPPPSRPLRLYFTPGGALSRHRPSTAAVRQYAYDPVHPVPTLGGQEAFLPGGPRDQRPVENRPDMLLFTSEPLEKPLEITGRLWVRLYAASSVRDTDFTAKLTDVYPDGRSMLVSDGIVRARYRRSLEKTTPTTPGKAYAYGIDLWSTSLIVNRGHRIRVAISSSNAPRFEPNPNSWPPDPGATPVIAQQKLLLGGAQASCIILPQPLLAAAHRERT